MSRTEEKRILSPRRCIQRYSALKGGGTPADLCEVLTMGHQGGRGSRGNSNRDWGLAVKFEPEVKNHVSHAEVFRHYPVVRVGAKKLHGGEWHDPISF